MTFKDAVQTTYTELFPALRDELTALTNWSLTTEQAADATAYANGDYFVVETPNNEFLRIACNRNDGAYEERSYLEVGFQWGKNWDSTNNNWGTNSEYKFTKGNASFPIMEDSDTYERTTDGNTLQDPVTYWLYKADAEGFVLVAERTEGDGNDQSGAVGYATLNKLWDYTLASSYESRGAVLLQGDRTPNECNILGFGGESSETTTAYGRANGDANFSNFPLIQQNVVATDQYSGTIIGAHDLWMEDHGNSAHGDTIQDSGGTDIFKVLRPTNHMERIGIKL